ncbi:hypothetical protein ACFW2V_13505 [Streptomyces sp. NPDC058947]|uniref:hypothetical protein n=1 Tax=Streptomyces sp. NPDC058947 TaxID=3346675 RepID=UPI003690965B
MINEGRHPLTGLRVRVTMKGETVYGLARVRFGEGHRYAGHYEVQRVGAASILAPFESVEPGPNADRIPPGVEFPDRREPYRPAFAEPGVKQTRAEISGANVIFPGDYALLRDLINEVKPGWSADWFSHGCNEFRGTRKIVGNDGKRIEFTPMKGVFSDSGWPEEGDDFTIHRTRKGIKLTEYDPDNAYCGGRASCVTITFSPPSLY